MENLDKTNQPLSYLDMSLQGNSSPWRYVSGAFAILFIWLVLGGMATLILLAFIIVFQFTDTVDVIQLLQDPRQLGAIPYYLVLNLGFIFFFFGLWLVNNLIHGRSLRTLVTARDKISWKRIMAGFSAWFLLLILASLIEYMIWPEAFTLNFNPRIFIPFTILALLITPIQTTSEELFFRGYLVQGGSLISRNWVFLSIWSGVLFALPHAANPEVETNFGLVMLSFFVLGSFLTWISLKDGSTELAIGIHAANNLLAALFLTMPDSVLPTPAIFSTTHFDPLFSLISVLILCVVVYVLFFIWRGGNKRSKQIETSLGEY